MCIVKLNSTLSIKMKFYKNLEKRMLIILIFISLYLAYYFFARDYGINKTVGWAYSIREVSFAFTCLNCFLFTIAYGIIRLLKYITNKFFSLLHLVIILLVIILDHFYQYNSIMILNLISFIVFIINLILSIKNRKTVLI